MGLMGIREGGCEKSKQINTEIMCCLSIILSDNSHDCIATRYGLDGPGVESRWERDFPHSSRPALGPTQPPKIGYRVFPGCKEARA